MCLQTVPPGNSDPSGCAPGFEEGVWHRARPLPLLSFISRGIVGWVDVGPGGKRPLVPSRCLPISVGGKRITQDQRLGGTAEE